MLIKVGEGITLDTVPMLTREADDHLGLMNFYLNQTFGRRSTSILSLQGHLTSNIKMGIGRLYMVSCMLVKAYCCVHNLNDGEQGAMTGATAL